MQQRNIKTHQAHFIPPNHTVTKKPTKLIFPTSTFCPPWTASRWRRFWRGDGLKGVVRSSGVLGLQHYFIMRSRLRGKTKKEEKRENKIAENVWTYFNISGKVFSNFYLSINRFCLEGYFLFYEGNFLSTLLWFRKFDTTIV